MRFNKKRTVFNCLVVGATGSGKSSFLDAFLGNLKEERKDPLNPDISFRGTHFPQKNEIRSVVKAIQEKKFGLGKKVIVNYLTMTEVPAEIILSKAFFDDSKH